MEKYPRILIVAGETSGELHACNLAKALKELNPNIKISGVGGRLMQEAGVKVYRDIKDLAVLGLFDAIKKLPNFFALKKLLLEKIEQENIDAVVLIDFSGFNLRLARDINKKIPVIYYISPQVWASRPGRIKTIKKYISKMIVIFKFEEEFYKKFGVDADFVGHPLLDIIKPTMTKRDFLEKFGLSQTKTTIALLPGSRKSEIENILPVMLETASLIQNQIKEVQFIIAKAPLTEQAMFDNYTNNAKLNLKIIADSTYDCLNAADFCLVASGTATLETAIIQRPFVIIYRMGILNYLLYRPMVKVKHIGIINILAGKEIIPEFIQFRAQPDKIAKRVISILRDIKELERINKALLQICPLLGEKGASKKAARIILGLLDQHENKYN